MNGPVKQMVDDFLSSYAFYFALGIAFVLALTIAIMVLYNRKYSIRKEADDSHLASLVISALGGSANVSILHLDTGRAELSIKDPLLVEKDRVLALSGIKMDLSCSGCTILAKEGVIKGLSSPLDKQLEK